MFTLNGSGHTREELVALRDDAEDAFASVTLVNGVTKLLRVASDEGDVGGDVVAFVSGGVSLALSRAARSLTHTSRAASRPPLARGD